MGIKALQATIRAHGGYILSDGTLNLQHLLPKAYDLITAYNVRKSNAAALRRGILEVFALQRELWSSDFNMFTMQYWGWAVLKEDADSQEHASWLWNEDVFNLFNDIAPRGYYFGSSDGDGACIGWFRVEEFEPCMDHGSEPSDDIEQYLP